MTRLFNGIIFCAIICCLFIDKQYTNGLNGESTFEPELETEENAYGVKYDTFLDGATTGSSSEDLVTATPSYNFTSCYPNDVCFENETTSQVGHMNFQNFHCSCDQKCVKYRDCCETSVYYKKEEQTYIEQLPYTCLQFPGISSKISLLVETSCSSSWKEAEISEKCNSAKTYTLDMSNLDVTTPVIGYSTNTTYLNAYCALCNFEENFWYLNVTVACSKYSLKYSSEYLPTYVSPPPFLFETEYTIKYPVEYTMDYTTEYMTSTEIESIAEYTTTHRNEYDTEYVKNYYSSNGKLPEGCSLRLSITEQVPLDFCDPAIIISTCPAEWPDQETIELCRNFYSLVIGRLRKYRNKYCAYCNGIPNNEIFCSYPPIIHHLAHPSAPLTDLFDYRRLKNVQLCSGNISHSSAAVLKVKRNFCPDNDDNAFLAWYTGVALSLSIFFLILYLMMFSFVKELRNFGGKNLASLCLALILAYGSFLIRNFAKETSFCIVIGLLTYYSFLVAFVSMLTISFDLWQTFWNTKRKLRLSERQNIKFVAYCLWNWLIPVAPVSFALYLQIFRTQSEYSPRFGPNDCWFNNNASLLFFFALPVFLMILVNFSFFAHTLYLIQTNRYASASKQSRVDFKLYARLALLTGLTWVTGFIGEYFDEYWIKAVFVFLNTSQGIFIFAAFACKRNIMAVFLGQMGFSRKLTSRLKKAATAQTSSETNAMSNFTNLSNTRSAE